MPWARIGHRGSRRKRSGFPGRSGRPERNRTAVPAVTSGVQTARVVGATLVGADAELVTVEARFEPDEERRRTEVVLSGLPDAVIREGRGRLLAALAENRLAPGPGRLVLNLVPAGVRKQGEILDLPLALGAAAAAGYLDPRALLGTLFLGELGVDGRLHAVPGGLACALAARGAGIEDLVGPPATAGEASLLPGVRAWSAASLGDVVAWVARGGRGLTSAAAPPVAPEAAQSPAAAALDEVRGQATAKEALLCAAAGGHALLFVGPPGTGKSLLARALVGLLPEPALEERLEITRVLSAAGRWPAGLARGRPFRAPHPTTSFAGLVGGGSPPAPGVITLAHGGVLFLDELPEWKRDVLECLRQPLEEGRITIARAGRRLELPARFQFVAAMNPCPCGYRGHGRTPCSCAPGDVRRYLRRISGPLLDRIDLRLELTAPSIAELAIPPPDAAAAFAERVEAAAHRARARQGPAQNARLDAADLDRCAPLDRGSRRLLERAMERRNLSARAVQSLRRIARTLADLAGEEAPKERHLAQALALRAPLEVV